MEEFSPLQHKHTGTDTPKIDYNDLLGIYNIRTQTVVSSATPTPVCDTADIFTITALAEAATFAVPTGTPINGQKLIIRILDNGTARALAWNTIYAARGVALPTTTVISKYLYVGFIYNSTAVKWDCIASAQEA